MEVDGVRTYVQSEFNYTINMHFYVCVKKK